MNKYKERYVIETQFQAENDEEANKIEEKNLNAILKNGDFSVTTFKFERWVIEDVDQDAK